MGRLTHLYQPGMTYLITTVTHRRQRFFAEVDRAQAAHEDIAFYARKFNLVSLAHVVMPDHLHWIICPSPADFERFAREEREKKGKYADAPERFYLSKIMEDYKRHTSFVVNQLAATRGAQVWQDGFRDDGLRTPEAIKAAVRYVGLNPIKAGLVKRPEDYPYLAWAAEWLD
jgi:REP element-mobilizing transposase RayT